MVLLAVGSVDDQHAQLAGELVLLPKPVVGLQVAGDLEHLETDEVGLDPPAVLHQRGHLGPHKLAGPGERVDEQVNLHRLSQALQESGGFGTERVERALGVVKGAIEQVETTQPQVAEHIDEKQYPHQQHGSDQCVGAVHQPAHGGPLVLAAPGHQAGAQKEPHAQQQQATRDHQRQRLPAPFNQTAGEHLAKRTVQEWQRQPRDKQSQSSRRQGHDCQELTGRPNLIRRGFQTRCRDRIIHRATSPCKPSQSGRMRATGIIATSWLPEPWWPRKVTARPG